MYVARIARNVIRGNVGSISLDESKYRTIGSVLTEKEKILMKN